MKNFFIILLFNFLFLFILFPPIVIAENNIVINEFLVDPENQQWVELFNKGTITENISGWEIDDNGGKEKFTIPNETSISPGEFKVFESTYFNLNRSSADEIKLINKGALIDNYSYNSGPGENISFGREKDGSPNWVTFSSPTKGTTNNTSVPLPASTAVPTETPVPSNTPTPTKTPTPTHIPTPTRTPTPLKTPTPSPTSKLPTPTNTPAPKQSIISNITLKITSMPTKSPTPKLTYKLQPSSVLGLNTKSASPLPSIKPTKTPIKVQSSTTSNIFTLPWILSSIGSIFLIACAIIFYLIKKKTKNSNS